MALRGNLEGATASAAIALAPHATLEIAYLLGEAIGEVALDGALEPPGRVRSERMAAMILGPRMIS